MKLYLAGPMTAYPDFNKPAFASEAARLRGMGYEVINPAELNEGNDGDWLGCMRVDIKALVECDGIAFLPDWENSRGAPIEIRLARDLGLLVFPAARLAGLAGDMPVLAGEVLTDTAGAA